MIKHQHNDFTIIFKNETFYIQPNLNLFVNTPLLSKFELFSKLQTCIVDGPIKNVEKMFDSISRKLLFEYLRRLRLHLDLILALESFYDNVDAKFIIDGYLTRTIKYNNGVLQGSSHAPVLAILYYDIVIRYLEDNQKKLGFQILPKTFVVRAFADDLIQLSSSKKNAQKLLKATSTVFD